MLQPRNLDDQTFEQIMEHAKGRIPWLCPAWTDHNAHDPGITLLELMAWYKEMQQYHMNTMTDALRKKLLKLCGVVQHPASAASCYIALPEAGMRYRAMSRLSTLEGVVFELPMAAAGGAQVDFVYVEEDGHVTDVTDILAQPRISIRPFRHGGGRTQLLLGLSEIAEELRLWFEIEDELPVHRNAFVEDSQAPRHIRWEFAGMGVAVPKQDETYALSRSGYVVFDIPEDWVEGDAGLGLPPRRYLRLELEDPGCEEEVKLAQITACRFPAVQRETWCSMRAFTVGRGAARIELEDALSMEGQITAFLRYHDGLRQVAYQEGRSENRAVKLDAANSAQDGQPNLLLITVDPIHAGDVLFDSTGLPDMRLQLQLRAGRVLKKELALVCDTLQTDGSIRPEVWTCVEDLYCAGSRDRVFTYDSLREEIQFGDGQNGAVVPAGKGRVMIASMAVSFMEEGNIPENGGLQFHEGGRIVAHTAAYGGARAESVHEANLRLLRHLSLPQSCVSIADYERAALTTPGLRIAAARAIPDFDPEEPTGHSVIPVVSVVVVPYSEGPQALPDARFLAVVQRRLEAMRPICTRVKVLPPRYVGFVVSMQMIAESEKCATQARAVVEGCFSGNKEGAIGRPVVRNALINALTAIAGVAKVERLEIVPLHADCRTTSNGDIIIPGNAVAYLSRVDVDVKRYGGR